MLKKIALFLVVALIVIQFIHPAKNKANGTQANSITTAYSIPEDVKVILAKACTDCHTNNTNYPWYTHVQPVDLWMNNHIKDGKKHLNLDEYTNKSLRHQYHKMEEIAEQVQENEMPLESYTWMHGDAKLTEDEKEKINTLGGWHKSRNGIKISERWPHTKKIVVFLPGKPAKFTFLCSICIQKLSKLQTTKRHL